jgi:hypothetical protein
LADQASSPARRLAGVERPCSMGFGMANIQAVKGDLLDAETDACPDALEL